MSSFRGGGEAAVCGGRSREEHDPASDHASAINVMPEELMEEMVNAINSGQQG